MGNLGCSLHGQGKRAEAEQMQREVLDMQRRVLGPEHPDALITTSNLAASLHDQGKHAEAEQMQRKVLDVQRRVLGPEHPDMLATVSNLASLDSICSAATSIVPFVWRTHSLTSSHPADPEDGGQSHEPQSTSVPPDPHPEAPPAKRARR
jgi:hypothetical protein